MHACNISGVAHAMPWPPCLLQQHNGSGTVDILGYDSAPHSSYLDAGKTMNKKIMVAVEDAFIERFGPWAGWAHNTLFISELATQRERLPEHLRPGGKFKASKSITAAKGDTEEVSDQSETMKVEHAAVQKRSLTVGIDAVDGSTKSRPVKRARRVAKHKQTGMQGIGNNGNTGGHSDAVADEGLGVVKKAKSQKSASKANSKQNVGAVNRSDAAGAQLGICTRSSSMAVAADAAVDQALQDASTRL